MENKARKYRKKPVVIEALQWDGSARAMFEFLGGEKGSTLSLSGQAFEMDFSKNPVSGLVIKTLEGEHIASLGDYIIKGVQGEYYPCKPDIFEQTYELVENTDEI